MTTIFMFPGQGSQSKGMGAELFEQFPEVVAQADAQLGYSIATLCLEDPDSQLNQTQFTQPALYTVNALSWMARLADGGNPDFVLGHSLGEYNALLAAGAYDFVTGLRLVQRRGELMSRATGGGMAAILAMPPERIAEVLQESGFDGIDVANYNGPGQTVISGLKQDIEAVAPHFEAAGVKRFVILPVSGAFHSRYMREAQEEFSPTVEAVDFQPLDRPVIANSTGQPYVQDNIARTLLQQISQSVRWTESIGYLRAQPDPEFEEVGPGRVLAGMLRRM